MPFSKIVFCGKIMISFYDVFRPCFLVCLNYAVFGFVQCSLRLAKGCKSFGRVTFLW